MVCSNLNHQVTWIAEGKQKLSVCCFKTIRNRVAKKTSIDAHLRAVMLMAPWLRVWLWMILSACQWVIWRPPLPMLHLRKWKCSYLPNARYLSQTQPVLLLCTASGRKVMYSKSLTTTSPQWIMSNQFVPVTVSRKVSISRRQEAYRVKETLSYAGLQTRTHFFLSPLSSWQVYNE